MTPESWEIVKKAFESAEECDPRDRARVLSEVCAGDAALIEEARRLLQQHDEIGGFLAEPAITLSSEIAAGTVLAGRYEVEYLLGRGGMGEVYRARDRLLQETVALKTIRGDLIGNRALLQSLQREIQIARRVTHPNVCRVFDMGVHTFENASQAPLRFISMELLEGETLAARIERQGRLSQQESSPLATQMAEGLQAAHDAGVVHRDFKSANIILISANDRCRAVITDFGLARPDRSSDGQNETAGLSGNNLIAGTIGYMSPEQLTGEPVTVASDIYSFGIVLFEMVTGRLPFDDSHLIKAAIQRVSGGLPDIRQLAPDLDPQWEWVIRQCLKREPSLRLSSAKAVAEALTQRPWRFSAPQFTRRQWFGGTVIGATTTLAAIAWNLRREDYRPRPEAEGWYEKGVEAVHATTYEAGRKALEQAVAADPNYGPAHAYLAVALNELDYPARAREEILAALAVLERNRHSSEDEMRVKAAQFFVSANYDLAQPFVDELARRAQGRKKQEADLERGMVALYRKKPSEALAAFGGVLKADPSNAAAQLRIATVYAFQRSNEAALRAFDRAESIFRDANNFDGVTEALFQRGVFLTRVTRSADAVPVFEQGLAIARETRDLHHEVRLHLALGMAYANLGQTDRAQQTTELGIQKAISNKMEHAAAIGLLDLGNIYFVRGQAEMAEKHFQQGLEFARQSKGPREEARALLSLGSLRIQYDRPREALEFIQRALPFYEQGNYRRELTQALILLGRTQEQLGQLKQAGETLGKAVESGDKLGDAEQAGLAHSGLSVVNMEKGDFPKARAGQERALQLYSEVRGGLTGAFGLVILAQIEWRMGRYVEAAAALSKAEDRLAKLEGGQNRLKAEILSAQSEIAYSQLRWSTAFRLAKQALDQHPGPDGDLNAQLLAALSMFRMTANPATLADCKRLIERIEQKDRIFAALSGKVMLAQALWENRQPAQARELAQSALVFFEQVENWDAIWRCRRLILPAASSVQDSKLKETLDRGRQILGVETFGLYQKIPAIEKLLP